jgi:hypothetical protein
MIRNFHHVTSSLKMASEVGGRRVADSRAGTLGNVRLPSLTAFLSALSGDGGNVKQSSAAQNLRNQNNPGSGFDRRFTGEAIGRYEVRFPLAFGLVVFPSLCSI